jgi:hypothetical protein
MNDTGRTGAALARGQSKQDYGTPRKFLDAVVKRFGPLAFDLAAHQGNAVVSRWFGPGGEQQDALAASCSWKKPVSNCWLNPPFDTIRPWAEKCAATAGFRTLGKSPAIMKSELRASLLRQRILFLVPASVGSEWFAQYVDGEALVLLLRPRLSFDGKNPYPKDCLLACYGELPGYECWKWC